MIEKLLQADSWRLFSHGDGSGGGIDWRKTPASKFEIGYGTFQTEEIRDGDVIRRIYTSPSREREISPLFDRHARNAGWICEAEYQFDRDGQQSTEYILRQGGLSEKRAREERGETVRCVIEDAKGSVLLLLKGEGSLNKGRYELPGGKIDVLPYQGDFRYLIPRNYAVQLAAIEKEVDEETGGGINIRGKPLRPSLSDIALRKQFDQYMFDDPEKDIRYMRNVFMFHVKLPLGNYKVEVNTIVGEGGISEDKHAGAIWVPQHRLYSMRRDGELSRNSFGFPRVLHPWPQIG